MPHIGNFPGPGYPKPLSIPPSAFGPYIETQDWYKNYMELRSNTILTPQDFYAPFFLPHGVTIKKVTLYGRRISATDNLTLYLYRNNPLVGQEQLCVLAADWTDGFGSIYTETITTPKVDNESYNYCAKAILDPDTAAADIYLTGVKIDWS